MKTQEEDCIYFFFFFFKQKTAYEITHSDWSSDVCSSDLAGSPIFCCGSSPTPSCTSRRSSGPTSRGVTCSRPSSTTRDGTGGSAGSRPDMSRNLLVRIAVAVPAIAGAVAALWLGGWVLAAAIAVLGVLGTNEVYAFAKKLGVEPLEWVGFVAAAAFPFATYWAKDYADWEPVVYGGAAWLLVALVVAAARGPERHPLTALAVTSFGPLYASALLAFLVAIRHGPHVDAHPRGSVALAVMPLVITWVCDTCAMAAGALVGGPKLAPVLSPRKTWAGAIGGVVGGLLAALAYGPLVLERVALRLELWQLVTVGLVVAVAAQVGDVAESLFKREVGVKDSSSLIPGHGGVLDRLDSVYFVAPVAAALFRWFGLA